MRTLFGCTRLYLFLSGFSLAFVAEEVQLKVRANIRLRLEVPRGILEMWDGLDDLVR